MSLPSGYTKLQWIESSGTQYVDTRFTPDQDTGIEVDFQLNALNANNFIAGARYSTSSQNYTILMNTENAWRYGYNTTVGSAGSADLNRHTIKTEKNKLYLDNTLAYTATYANFTANGTAFIFAINAPTISYGKLRLYACKLYDNGTLVRDYVPAKTVEGEVGLYDRVNDEFYRNAGTGSFTAGPFPLQPPTAPTNFQSILAVVLSWTAAERAESYKLYRDGTLLGTSTTTQYVDTTVEANETYVYSIKAVNTAGESAATEVTVYTKAGYFEYKPLIQDANFP